MKKSLKLIILLTISVLSINTFATSPTPQREHWWSPASPENGGNGIAVDNQTTVDISVSTKHRIPPWNRKLNVSPKSYREYFNPSEEISREYGMEYHGLSGSVDINTSEQKRKIFLICGKGSQVVFQSQGFIGYTAKITMEGSPTGSVNIQGHHNTTYIIRWEWIYQYNIIERGMEFPYTKSICFFTITSSSNHTRHH